jgi:glutaredoxin-like protein NrdH
MTPPTTMLDIPRTAHGEPEIIIYGPEQCPNCEKAMGLFDRNKIAYTKISIEPGDKDHRYITEELGYITAPVIVLTFTSGANPHTVHWGGHRMDMLMATKSLVTNIRAEAESEDADKAAPVPA